MTSITFPSGPDWDAPFEAYARALGFLLRDWNAAQETMCNLFCALFKGDDESIARAAWYANRLDRSQRAMLKAACDCRFGPKAKISVETTWIIERMDNLGNQRDDAVHSPVSLMIGDPPEIVSQYFFGHRRATSLKGKKLLAELEIYRRTANTIRQFTLELKYHIQSLGQPSPFPLPRRPPELDRPPKNQGAKAHHKDHAK